MTIKQEVTITKLRDLTWDCDEFWRRFDESGMSDDALEAALADLHCDSEAIDLTELNDILRFDDTFADSLFGKEDEED